MFEEKNVVVRNQKEIREWVVKLIGEKVAVSVLTGDPESEYPTSIRVAGTLEGHPEGKQFRILPDENETSVFSYFHPEDVTALTHRGGEPVNSVGVKGMVWLWHTAVNDPKWKSTMDKAMDYLQYGG